MSRLRDIDEFIADHHSVAPLTNDVTQPAAISGHVTGSGSELVSGRSSCRQVEVGANEVGSPT